MDHANLDGDRPDAQLPGERKAVMALLAVNDRATAINGDADKGVVRGIGTTGLEPLTTQARSKVEVPAIIGLDVGCGLYRRSASGCRCPRVASSWKAEPVQAIW